MKRPGPDSPHVKNLVPLSGWPCTCRYPCAWEKGVGGDGVNKLDEVGAWWAEMRERGKARERAGMKREMRRKRAQDCNAPPRSHRR